MSDEEFPTYSYTENLPKLVSISLVCRSVYAKYFQPAPLVYGTIIVRAENYRHKSVYAKGLNIFSGEVYLHYIEGSTIYKEGGKVYT